MNCILYYAVRYVKLYTSVTFSMLTLVDRPYNLVMIILMLIIFNYRLFHTYVVNLNPCYIKEIKIRVYICITNGTSCSAYLNWI